MNDNAFKGYCKGFNDKKKYPKGNCGRGQDLYAYDEVKDLECFGAVCKDDIVDISFDDLDEEYSLLSEVMLDMIEHMNTKTYCLYSPRGVHTFWKIPKDMDIRDRISVLACGVPADIHHNNTYIPLMCYGEPRAEVFPGYHDIADLPEAFYPVGAEKNRALFLLGEGEGRNNELSAHIFRCASNAKLSPEAIEGITRELINKYVFSTPLDDHELDTIFRKETKDNLSRVQQDALDDGKYLQKGKFHHELMAEDIMKSDDMVFTHGSIRIFNGKYYEGDIDDSAVENKCLDLYPSITSKQRQEVLKYMKLRLPKSHASDPNFVTFNNGVYDIDNQCLIPHTPDLVDLTMIPWDFNPNAYSKIVDDTLNKLTCNDADVRLLLEEAIGYTFYRNTDYAAAFFLDGQGSNGKSTFYSMINAMVGPQNTASLDIDQLNDRFGTVSLMDKMVNIGSDITTKCRLGPSTLALFKKLVTGDLITADIKNHTPVSFSNYAKMFFACNGMPNLTSDSSIIRRLKIIPFNARFSKHDPGYDPHILKKLTSKESMEYLIQVGIKGLQRLLSNNGFTEPEIVTRAVELYETESDSCNAFIADFIDVHKDEGGMDAIIGQSTSDVRVLYEIFCSEAGMKYTVSWRNVMATIRRRFNIESSFGWSPDTKKRIYVFRKKPG